MKQHVNVAEHPKFDNIWKSSICYDDLALHLLNEFVMLLEQLICIY